MSTLILGFSIDDLCFFAVAMPLGAGFISTGLAVLSLRSHLEKGRALLNTVTLLAPCSSFIVILLLGTMLEGAPDGVLLGPYGPWISGSFGVLDGALWLDPLALAVGLLLSALAGVKAFCLLATQQQRARLSAVLNLGLGFALLAVWAENLTTFIVAYTPLLLVLAKGTSRATIKALAWGLLSVGLLFSGFVLGLSQSTGTTGPVALGFQALQDHMGMQNIFVLGLLLLAPALPLGIFPVLQASSVDDPLNPITASWRFLLLLVVASSFWVRLFSITLQEPDLLLSLELLGVLTQVTAALIALGQQQSRRFIHWLAISQAGAVMSAVGAGSLERGLYHALITVTMVLVLGCLGQVWQGAGGDDSWSELSKTRMPLWFRCAWFWSLMTLIGLAPTIGFLSHYQISWYFLTQERYVTWFLDLLACLIAVVAVARVTYWTWPRRAMKSVRGRIPHAGIVATLMLGTVLLSIVAGVLHIPASWGGPDLFQKLFLTVFENLLPIRSEAYGPQVASGLAWGLGLGFWLCFGLTCWHSVRVKSIPQRFIQDRMSQILQLDLLSIGIKPFRWIGQHVLEGFFVQQIQRGLLAEGVTASVRLSGRTLLLLQSGQLQHYLFWVFLVLILLLGILLP